MGVFAKNGLSNTKHDQIWIEKWSEADEAILADFFTM